MLCPNCQTEVREGAAFCPSCGAELPKEPAAPAADDYAEQQARYEQELAAYQWQQAAYEQQQYAQQTPPAAPAVKKGKGGLVVAIVAIALVLLVGCGIGGVFLARTLFDTATDIEVAPETGTPADAQDDASDAAYTSAEEAIAAQLAEEGLGDWVFDVSEEGDGYVVFIAGPPASEYVSQYTVAENADGTWSVAEVVAIGFEDIDAGSAMEAEQVVWEYLIAVSEDRGLDAQSWTVDPFHSDSASAQVSAGGLTDYAITGSFGEPDGSYRVQTTQTWYGSTENWEYWVVPTEAGYRIAELQPW